MNRFLWVARGDLRKLRLGAAIQMTLPPPPIIYYGTEAGHRAEAATCAPGAAMSKRGASCPGARSDADLLAFYQRLIALRRDHPVIWQGTRTTAVPGRGHRLVCLRLQRARPSRAWRCC